MTMSKARCPERKQKEDERQPPPTLHFRKLPRAGGLLMATICGGRAAGIAAMPGPRGRGDTSSSGPVTQKRLSQPTI